MSLNPEELFQKLLEQIGLKNAIEYQPYFKKGEIKKVTVHKISKTWHFNLKFEDILPFEVYQVFIEKLQLTFSSIATVAVTIETTNPSITIEKLEQYWPSAVINSGVSSPLCNRAFQEQLPLLSGKKILFLVENEVVKGHLVNQYLPPVEVAYQSLGFPIFKIEPVIDEESYNKKIAEFKAKKEEADELLSIRAGENLKKAEEEKKYNKEKGIENIAKGPIVLGRKIADKEEVKQMDQIIEEERRVTIEGYVFDVEIRVLRSERQLLIVKITDYTSSFTVKKFSNT